MLAAQDVAVRCKEIGITALHIKLRATGGNRWAILDHCCSIVDTSNLNSMDSFFRLSCSFHVKLNQSFISILGEKQI